MKSAPVIPQPQLKTDHLVDGSVPLLPHERDEMPETKASVPREVMKQAYQDLQRCLVDTDLHGQRGVEEVLKNSKNSESKK
ncbi:MAG: hypothetical protein Q7T62_01865 [Undibacterium sp.]|nr:hypothetical protein [Undibacterium sp.]